MPTTLNEPTLQERLAALRTTLEDALDQAKAQGETTLVLRCVTQLHALLKTEARLSALSQSGKR
jgi:hypothetical protein